MSLASPLKGLKLEMAVVVSDEWRTQQAIAKLLGRQSADIQKGLRQLVDDDVVEASDPDPGRGTRYRLKPEHRDELEQALASEQAPGILAANQTVLLVRAPSLRALDRELANPANTGAVAWAAAGQSAREMILVLRTDATYEQLHRIEAALERAGAEHWTHKASAIVSARQMRSAAASDGPPAPSAAMVEPTGVG